jgi:Holliday junction resolvase-like predicted endonuclease
VKKKQTEQPIQAAIIKDLEGKGYYVIKLSLTNKNGIPDLIAIPNNSDVLFVEVKRPGGKSSPLQEYRKKELESRGINVVTKDSAK